MPTIQIPQIDPSVAFVHIILPNITEEALMQYFQSATSSLLIAPSDGSPTDDHFQHVEQFMTNEVPIDPQC